MLHVQLVLFDDLVGLQHLKAFTPASITLRTLGPKPSEPTLHPERNTPEFYGAFTYSQALASRRCLRLS